MSGINLLNQLKTKKSGAAAPASASSFKLRLPSGPTDAVGLMLRLILLTILGYGGFLGIDQYHNEERSKVEDELAQLQQALSKENKKKAELKSIGDEMRGYIARVEELEGKLRAVSQQETDRSYLVRALEYVAVEMPKEIWLSEISTARGDTDPNGQVQKSTATLRGYAINAQSVSDFIQKLEASVYFPTTTLDQLELIQGAEVGISQPGVIPVPPNSRRFQIMAKLGE